MATIRQINRRIKSVRNTSKVTKAMEMIAASKMRRAQERTLAARPYAEKIQEVLANLAAQTRVGEESHPLLVKRLVKKVAVVHMTPDRGLCGGLVANVNRNFARFILDSKGMPVTNVAIGRKGRDFMLRTGLDVRAEFINMSDKPSVSDILPVARIVVDDYTAGLIDEVYVSYTQFVNTAVQKATIMKLLPIEAAVFESGKNNDYIYEPTSQAVLSDLLPRFIEMSLYHDLLEAIASEQSARMVAMRNATDNAHELIGELTLRYNKARQEMITKELLDIVGGVAALE